MENLHHNKGELQLRMDHIRKTDPTLAVQGLPDPETWSVQLFRSIDSGQHNTAHNQTAYRPGMQNMLSKQPARKADDILRLVTRATCVLRFMS